MWLLRLVFLLSSDVKLFVRLFVVASSPSGCGNPNGAKLGSVRTWLPPRLLRPPVMDRRALLHSPREGCTRRPLECIAQASQRINSQLTALTSDPYNADMDGMSDTDDMADIDKMTQSNPLPLELYRAADVRELDRIAIEDRGLGGALLMNRAGEVAFQALRERWPRAQRIAVLCGPGNNGGDGLVIARLARLSGLEVRVLLMREAEAFRGEARRALQALEPLGVALPVYAGEADLDAAEVVVDALLGTGLTRAVEGTIAQAIGAINAAREVGAGVLAVDIPSGLAADTGAVLGHAVRAHVTPTFIGLKLGLFTGAGPEYVGRVVFSNLGAPSDIYEQVPPAARCIDDGGRGLGPRPRDAHKRQFGHVLAVGGDRGTAGAIRLTAEAALRGGAGLVSVATRPENAPALVQARPEVMALGVDRPTDLDGLLARASVIAVGPGLGQTQWGRALWQHLLETELPMVVDADALNLLAAEPVRRNNWMITPHPGEAARLLDTGTGEVQADRPAAVGELARRYGGVAVLKGAGTLVASANSPLGVCRAGNPGMAVGGMGDLLCGYIAALRGQGLDALSAAQLGVLWHACAGDRAASLGGERGLLPSDLLLDLRHFVNR